MKCSACGEDNIPNARFCSFCGAKLTAAPEAEPAQSTPVRSSAEKIPVSTAQPLSDNPYQPRRMPTIYENSSEPVHIDNPAPSQPRSTPIFLFDDEKEEEEQNKRREAARLKAEEAHRELERQKAVDPFYGEEDDEDYDDEEDEDTGAHRGRIITVIISLITLLILGIALYTFMFFTSTGCRLRAYYGLSAGADDYIALADWQLEKGNETDAATSYYNAFLLNQNDYEFVLSIAENFEACRAYERAEQTYMYLIEKFPDADDPYDNLMALLVREGKTETYDALLSYRAEHQSGYTAPAASHAPALTVAPVISPEGGEYTGTVKITLTAEEGAAIYFTADGTNPSTDSALYTGVITLYSGTYTIKAMAISPSGQASEIVTAVYSVS